MIQFIKLTLLNFQSHKNSTFVFQNDKVTLLIGQNCDDSAQKRNGSGKSSIIEGISYCVTGASIRNVKNVELINNEEESCTLQLTLFDSKSPAIFRIVRTISRKKSAECKLFIDEPSEGEGPTEREIVLSSVNEYNDYILSKIFDISKEDFWNYFLITRERYQNFLSASDTYKKQIINRFSKANDLDGIDEIIKGKIAKLNIADFEKKLIRLESEYEVKTELVETQKGGKDEDKEELNKLFDENIKEQEIGLQAVESALEQVKTDGKKKQQQISDSIVLEEGYTSQIKQNEELRGVELRNTDEEYIKQINLVKQEIQTKVSERKKIDGETVEYSTLQRRFTVLLAGKITCPSCKHQFLHESDFSLDEAETAKKEVDEQLELLVMLMDENTKECTDYNELLEHLQGERETKRTEIITKFSAILSNLDTNFKQQKEITGKFEDERRKLLNEYQLYEGQIKVFKMNIENYQKQKADLNDVVKNSKALESLEVELLKLEEIINEEKVKIEDLKFTASELEAWKVKFKQFKSFIANRSIKTIENQTNFFLEKLDSNISIYLDGYKEVGGKLKEEIYAEVYRNGFSEGSYGKFSAGEKCRIDICNILAIQELINLNSKSGGIDLLICDEILDSVDVEGLEIITNSLGNTKKTIVIVSQNEINSLQQQTVIVKKEHGESLILTP